MARYIDADKLMESMRNGLFPNEKIETPFDVLRAIEQTPTADVVEVKHGEWISPRPSGGYDFYCSCCKEFAITYEDSNYREQYHLTDYCPNCGAKMDGEKALKEREKQ